MLLLPEVSQIRNKGLVLNNVHKKHNPIYVVIVVIVIVVVVVIVTVTVTFINVLARR